MITFKEIYDSRPDKREVGSSGYSNMQNLYDICRWLEPELIIESGTWKGNSSWLFHHFAPVICHDIQFDTLQWCSDQIKYIKEDISLHDYRNVPDKTLFYFDDHISQKARLEWLLSQKAKYVVFDDNQPYEIVKTLKNPATPTLTEMKENDDELINEIRFYRVLPFHDKNRLPLDTRLTYIEL